MSIPASADATLYQSGTGDLANGAGENIFAGVTAQGAIRRALISFDLAGSLPAGATITSVRLVLFMNQGRLAPAAIHQVLGSWSEGSVNAGGAEGQGAAATAGSTTWIHRDRPGSTWITSGGDFASIASASADITSTGFVSWTGAGLLADVQEWQTQPETNFGWAILGTEFQPQTANRFASRTSPASANRPALVVDYTPIPEPSSVAGLALTSILFQCARHRTRRPRLTAGARS